MIEITNTMDEGKLLDYYEKYKGYSSDLFDNEDWNGFDAFIDLYDVEEIQDYELAYYSDEDLFNLSYQKGCYRRIMKRKAAKRSAEKMEKVLEDRLSDANYRVTSAQRDVERLREKLEELRKGNLEIHI